MSKYKVNDQVRISTITGRIVSINKTGIDISYNIKADNSGIVYQYCNEKEIDPCILDGSNIVYVDFKHSKRQISKEVYHLLNPIKKGVQNVG